MLSTANHSSLNFLTVALLFPIVTGFTKEAPQATVTTATKEATVVEQALPREAGEPRYSWRRAALEAKGEGTGGTGTIRADAAAAPESETVHSWETGAGKSYLVPAVEIPTFLLLLNIYDRIVYSDEEIDGKKSYDSDLSTTWDHLRHQNWGIDKDTYSVNQFGHPYQGATMYGLARSSGLGFWESWAYSHAGSFIWKMAGETDRPSLNDMITTGNAGSLLGEALFRMSALVLRDNGRPDVLHEIGAGLLSPATAVNRFAFGDRFKSVFPSRSPATFWRLGSGALLVPEQYATIDFQMSYGLPGKPGYSYQRPLDYFDFQVNGITSPSHAEGNLMLRGLLAGKSYDVGDDYRGIWGLYGSYDYLTGSNFRVSTTALSLGSTGQYWINPDLALQGSVLGGVGFGGAGRTPTEIGKRDYHYGVTPQGMLSLRLLFGTKMTLENAVRGYFVSGTGSDNGAGSESMVRVNSNVIFRVYRRHGVGLQFEEAIREGSYGNFPTRHQSKATFGIFYTYLGDSHFGAVQWQQPDER